jgi:Ran GTPase-activating protein (RanGAP) involved in mRNA processing and transport
VLFRLCTAAALAEAIEATTTLKVLNMSDNYLGEQGAQSLARALVKNKSIVELHIKVGCGDGERDKGAGVG